MCTIKMCGTIHKKLITVAFSGKWNVSFLHYTFMYCVIDFSVCTCINLLTKNKCLPTSPHIYFDNMPGGNTIKIESSHGEGN